MLAFSLGRYFSFVGIDVLIVHGVLDNLVLFRMQFELYQELRKHSIDSLQREIRLSQLVLAIETVPDIAHGTVVLGNAAHGISHKGYSCPWMHTLLDLYA